jgi:hypothetical protein
MPTVRACERLRGSLAQQRPAAARAPDDPAALSSMTSRLAAKQAQLLGLLGRSLVEQAARLLVEEASDQVVPLPQRPLAAMLGVQRPPSTRSSSSSGTKARSQSATARSAFWMARLDRLAGGRP